MTRPEPAIKRNRGLRIMSLQYDVKITALNIIIVLTINFTLTLLMIQVLC